MPHEVDTAALAQAVPGQVRLICERLHERGHAAWVVGGCVRDHLLNGLFPDREPRAPGDWDITTSALPEQVQRWFPKVIPTGLEHGTVTVLIDKVPYEVTTFRAEANYTDGRRPGQVVFLDDIAADLARRDFTVNAIAYNPLTETLADPFGGINDLRLGLIRAVRNPAERFAEDGLRVLRATRFLATLEFTLEPHTAECIRLSLNSYRKVSAERIREEWVKALKARRPSLAFEAMAAHGLLEATVPELDALYSSAFWPHAMQCLDRSKVVVELRLALLLMGITSENLAPPVALTHYNTSVVESILTRLRFSNQERTRVARLIQHHDLPDAYAPSDAELRRWLRDVGLDLVDDVFQLAGTRFNVERFEGLRKRVNAVVEQEPALSIKDLAVNGQDLMQELRVKPGRELGQLLSAMFEAVTDEPDLNRRDALLVWARARLESK